MPDLGGLVLSLPTESVAVRATVGSLLALALVAFLLRNGLRVPRVRVAAVLLPVAALVGAVLLSWDELLLPFVWWPGTDGPLPILAGDSFVHFAPVAWPLATAWVLVSGVRIGRRVRSLLRMRMIAAGGAPSRDLRVHRLTVQLARRLRLSPPRVAVVDGCPGGAVVVGVREPTVVIDASVLRDLDDEELEGLLAHELAHVRRRDNLVGLLVALVRDVCFFVPGGRWVIRRLCAERELAADQLAIGVTERPGALASGLLKVMDQHRPAVACAAFAAPAALVARVEWLLADQRSPRHLRAASEALLVGGVLTLALAAAVQLPAAVVGTSTQREMLALVWPLGDDAPASEPAPVVFDVFHHSVPYEPTVPRATTRPLQDGREFHPGVLRGDRTGPPAVQVLPSQTRPRVNVVLDAELQRQWRATPLVTAGGGAGIYWLGTHQEPW